MISLPILLAALTGASDPATHGQPEPLSRPDVARSRITLGFAQDDSRRYWISPRGLVRLDGADGLGSRLPIPHLAFMAGVKLRIHPRFWIAPMIATQFTKDLTTSHDTFGYSGGVSLKAMPTWNFGLTADLQWVKPSVSLPVVLHGYKSLDTYRWFGLPFGLGVHLEHWDVRAVYGPHVRLGNDKFFIEAQLNAGTGRPLSVENGRILLTFIFEDIDDNAAKRDERPAMFGAKQRTAPLTH